MHYVIGDIHNENRKLQNMLKKISFGENDHLYLLGDLFDRGGESANPMGVYFTVLGLKERCTVVRGNHDAWLADYIRYFEGLPERKRDSCWPYVYESFGILQRKLTSVDLLQLADFIDGLPLQAKLDLGGKQLSVRPRHDVPARKVEKERVLSDGWGGLRKICDGRFSGLYLFLRALSHK